LASARNSSQYLSDEEYAKLQQTLAERPDAGDVIPGSRGVRKIRWGVAGRGKRGGVRVIYYVRSRPGQIWMLTLYAKNVSENISAHVVKQIKRRSMPRGKRDIGMEILTGIRQLKRGGHGRTFSVPSVSAIREKTGLSQARFASLLGVSVRTLQEWEQGRRAPSGAARTLLLIAAKNPRALLDVA
jgi:DNA-binding transcriptional regulator YiaG/mRNA-degrading endonuclease RelE of RelBE toxin-antitoxin system